MRICEICGRTEEETRVIKSKTKTLCRKHYLQLRRHGECLEKTIADRNDYVIHEDYAEIILRNRQCKEVGRALIDLEDVEKCKPISWSLAEYKNLSYANGWINHKGNRKKVRLHRYILEAVDSDLVVDHNYIRDGLINFKSNLRLCTQSENCRNQGLHRKGILKTPSGKFSASITVNYKAIFLGTFPTHEEALKARLDFEKTL